MNQYMYIYNASRIKAHKVWTGYYLRFQIVHSGGGGLIGGVASRKMFLLLLARLIRCPLPLALVRSVFAMHLNQFLLHFGIMSNEKIKYFDVLREGNVQSQSMVNYPFNADFLLYCILIYINITRNLNIITKVFIYQKKLSIQP